MAPDLTKVKFCNKCNLEFQGITCKPCLKKYKAGHYIKNKESIDRKNKENYYKKHEYYLEYHKQRYVDNKEEIDKNNALWRLKNPEYQQTYNKQYYVENYHQIKQNTRNYAINNPDKVLIWGRKGSKLYRARNLEKCIENGRIYRNNNKDKCLKSTREWFKNNPERAAFYRLERRSRDINAPGFCSEEQLTARINFYGGMCAYCKIKPYRHIDHVIPLSKGGSNWPSNLRPACAFCNLSKGSKKLREWCK